jgi:ribosomal protein L16 Arg81 hydroxylase
MVLVKAPNAQLAQDAMNNAIVRHKPNTSNLMFHSDCFLSSAAKNLRYFTKNKPSFCQNKKIVAITSHFIINQLLKNI